MSYRDHITTFGAGADVPMVVSSRFAEPAGHTLDGYRSTGSYRGYQALERVLTMAPSAVATAVRDATLLGRGGAGFPAGVASLHRHQR